jgi:HEAT repeat protein
MTKKRVLRLCLYATLAAFALLILSHPYIRQSVIGPKIHGEPFWAWQQEIRARAGNNANPSSLWEKALNLMHIDHRPMSWIGQFDPSDPEMLPVILSLEDDPDELVRGNVAWYLGHPAPASPESAKALTRMLDDRSNYVRLCALMTLQKYVESYPACRPKIEERLRDADDSVRFCAAQVILNTGINTKEAAEVLINGLKSPMVLVRQRAANNLMACNDTLRKTPELFPILVDTVRNDSDALTRRFAISALGRFGKKAIPDLVLSLQDANADCVAAAIWRLGEIGPEAAASIPLLEKHANHSSVYVREAVEHSLPKIDPKRAKKAPDQ